MRKSIFAAAAAAGLLFEVSAAGAATLTPLVASSSDGNPSITFVSGGCGIGFHRGPYGGCRANFYRPYGYGYGYRRPFYRPYGYGYGYRRFF